ncbi:UNVERIFIED_CONTAM: hypothetical protein Slati_3449600 [Sesamum latifolium]|uniref:Integrase catalytic domain-containing protein n=1 Tax=Sesamum latifolium TaxID=2727402 RepID=A0AAW2UIK7_9LAMI
MEGIKIACPFDQWGIDIVGPFPLAPAQKKFMIVAIEYFSKWVEAEALAKISEKEGKKIVAWCKELKIQQNFTAVGNPQANGQTEVTNRILLQHLKTRLDGAKGSWVEELPGVLWAYRTTPRSATGETPFCLVKERVGVFEDATLQEIDDEGIQSEGEATKLSSVCDIVLKRVEVSKHVGKLDPTWEGPYKVTEIKKKGTYAL